MTLTVADDQGTGYLRLPALPSSVGAARRLVRETLPGTPELADLVEAAELVISEAVTNAVVHTGTTIDVRVQFTGHEARLEVRDGSAHLPTPRDYAATAGTGRGLMLIDQLTTSWGTLPQSDGKTVWFLLDGHAQPVESGNGPLRPAAVPRSTGRTFDVELSQFPVLLYITWLEYAETLLRDFLLARLDIEDDEDAIRVHSEGSQALALLVERIETPTLGDDPRQLLEQAATESLTTAQIHLRLPPEARGLFLALDRSMEAAGQRAELAASLAAPVQPEMRQFRRWLCGQVVAQAEGQPPAPWTPEPNDVRLPARAFDPLEWDVAQFVPARGTYIAVDDTNGIVAVSDGTAQILGYESPEQLVGQRLVTIIPARYRQAHVAGFTRHLLDGRDPLLHTSLALPLRRRDGTERACMVHISKHHSEGGRAVFVAAIDPL